jgi:hypothetical protein
VDGLVEKLSTPPDHRVGFDTNGVPFGESDSLFSALSTHLDGGGIWAIPMVPVVLLLMAFRLVMCCSSNSTPSQRGFYLRPSRSPRSQTSLSAGRSKRRGTKSDKSRAGQEYHQVASLDDVVKSPSLNHTPQKDINNTPPKEIGCNGNGNEDNSNNDNNNHATPNSVIPVGGSHPSSAAFSPSVVSDEE